MEMYREFPTTSLPATITKIKQVALDYPKNIPTVIQFADSCGYTYPGNSAAHNFLLSCSSFGLANINIKDRHARLSQLALEIIETPSHENTLKAALSPPLFKEMHEYFNDPSDVPSYPEIAQYLSRKPFSDHIIKQLTKAYYGTMKYVQSFKGTRIQRIRLFDKEELVTIFDDGQHPIGELKQIVLKLLEKESAFRDQQNKEWEKTCNTLSNNA